MNKKEFEDISKDVYNELLQAYIKHGENNENRKNLYVSYTILVEEVGEVAQALIDADFNGTATYKDLKKELLQVTAMAMELTHEVNKRLT